jgi:hypothetical protein
VQKLNVDHVAECTRPLEPYQYTDSIMYNRVRAGKWGIDALLFCVVAITAYAAVRSRPVAGPTIKPAFAVDDADELWWAPHRYYNRFPTLIGSPGAGRILPLDGGS